VIRYSLICAAEHRFEGWFRNSADFDTQSARGLVACPVCASSQVRKALMAPAVAAEREAMPKPAPALIGEPERAMREMMRRVRDEVLTNARDVGHDFARVARQMHDGEIARDSVYGKASPDEVKGLAEDGIAFHPLPVLAEESN
jgi:hypothetical protein